MLRTKRLIAVGALALVGAAAPIVAQDEVPDSEELFDAVRDDDARTVQQMLDDGGDANAATDRGLSALGYASIHGYADVATALIAAGADVNHKDPAGATSLSYASQFGHVEIIDALIEAGADVNAKDTSDWTPLIRAAVGGQAEAVTRLMAAGADASAQSFLGQTAQKIAETNGDQAVLDALSGDSGSSPS